MSHVAQARAVIVGAGIVGNCMAYHLAKLGWRDMILIDKGPLPNPGARPATPLTSSSRRTSGRRRRG